MPRYPDFGAPSQRGRAAFAPPLFRQTSDPAGGRFSGRDCTLTSGLSLHRDKSGPEVVWQQTALAEGAFALTIATKPDDQPFLSLAIALPGEFQARLSRASLLFLHLRCDMVGPVPVTARLNFTHQPNPGQIWAEPDDPVHFGRAGFELRHCQSDPATATSAWVDVFFNAPGANQITLSALQITCRPRAEF